jgi:biotin operon repressor
MADAFSRQKMRWLNSVMYCKQFTPTVCRVAYMLADYLNRATQDCWPAQETIARKLGISTKTVQRSVRRLESMGVLQIRRPKRRGQTHRYAPVLKPASDFSDPAKRQGSQNAGVRDVRQSYLENPYRSYLGADRKSGGRAQRASDRGRIEIEVARRFGSDGIEILNRLAEIDDRFVDRLCEAHRNGSLTDEALSAARLAAHQVRR